MLSGLFDLVGAVTALLENLIGLLTFGIVG